MRDSGARPARDRRLSRTALPRSRVRGEHPGSPDIHPGSSAGVRGDSLLFRVWCIEQIDGLSPEVLRAVVGSSPAQASLECLRDIIVPVRRCVPGTSHRHVFEYFAAHGATAVHGGSPRPCDAMGPLGRAKTRDQPAPGPVMLGAPGFEPGDLRLARATKANLLSVGIRKAPRQTRRRLARLPCVWDLLVPLLWHVCGMRESSRPPKHLGPGPPSTSTRMTQSHRAHAVAHPAETPDVSRAAGISRLHG
jgi:hypothetical protein